MVSQSQSFQLLDVLEQIGAGDCGEVSVAEEVDVPKEQQKQQQEGEIDTDSVTYESDTNHSDLSPDDTAELFSLCQEIQNLVDDGPNNNLNETDLSVISMISEIPDEVAKSQTSKDECSEDKSNILDFLNVLDSDSGFGSEDDSDFSSTKSIDNDFLDLFPSLSSI